MIPIEIILPLEEHGYPKPVKERTRMILAALAESGADLDRIQIIKPEIKGLSSQADRAQVRPHAFVTFDDPIKAATFLVAISEDRERAAMFKMFWSGES